MAEDPDGHVALIEFDVHGDGDYDAAQRVRARRDRPTPSTAYPDPIVGRHTTAARITDDAGARTELTTGVEVHAENLPPIVAVAVLAPSAPRPGEPVTVSARRERPRWAQAPGVAFDLDGDGSYETDGPATTCNTRRGRARDRGAGAGRRRRRDDRAGAAWRSTRTPGTPFEIRSRQPRWCGRARRVPLLGVRVAVWRGTLDDDGAFDDDRHACVPGPPARSPVRARAADGRVAMRTVAVVADRGIAPAVIELGLPVAIQRGSADDVPRRGGRPGRRAGDAGVRARRRRRGSTSDRARCGGGYRWTFPAPAR